MNDDDLITAVRDSFTDVHSDTSVERIVTRSPAVRAADGKLFQDDESIFTMPAGHGTPAMNPVDGEADLTVTGTYIRVYPPRHAWGTWHHLLSAGSR
jgi:hypothetical protein